MKPVGSTPGGRASRGDRRLGGSPTARRCPGRRGAGCRGGVDAGSSDALLRAWSTWGSPMGSYGSPDRMHLGARPDRDDPIRL